VSFADSTIRAGRWIASADYATYGWHLMRGLEYGALVYIELVEDATQKSDPCLPGASVDEITI
jgi:hypothetical protein